MIANLIIIIYLSVYFLKTRIKKALGIVVLFNSFINIAIKVIELTIYTLIIAVSVGVVRLRRTVAVTMLSPPLTGR